MAAKEDVDSEPPYGRTTATGRRPSLGSSLGPFSPSQCAPGRLFREIEQAKNDVQNIIEQSCKKREKDFYKSDGWAQAIAASHWFGSLTIAVIAANTIWIGVEADHNENDNLWDSHWVFIVVENMLCVFYIMELFVRFAAFNVKCDVLKDAWFCFDTVLVVVMVIEMWGFFVLFAGLKDAGPWVFIRVARVCRILRIVRVARLARSCPEIMVIIDGMRVAMRSVFFTLLTLISFIYLFAVIFRQMSIDTELADEHHYFDTVVNAMFTLTSMGLYGEEIVPLFAALRQAGFIFVAFFLVFLFVCTHTIMNFMVAVLCQVVGSIAAREELQTLVDQTQFRLTEVIDKTFPWIDRDFITRDDILAVCRDARTIKTLMALDVDAADLLELIDTVFHPETSLRERDTIDFPMFLRFVVSLRGSNQATVRDLMHTRRAVYTYFNELIGQQYKTEKLMLRGMTSLRDPRWSDAATEEDSLHDVDSVVAMGRETHYATLDASDGNVVAARSRPATPEKVADVTVEELSARMVDMSSRLFHLLHSAAKKEEAAAGEEEDGGPSRGRRRRERSRAYWPDTSTAAALPHQVPDTSSEEGQAHRLRGTADPGSARKALARGGVRVPAQSPTVLAGIAPASGSSRAPSEQDFNQPRDAMDASELAFAAGP